MGSGCEYRRSFVGSPAAHLLPCDLVPNRPQTGTSLWPRGVFSVVLSLWTWTASSSKWSDQELVPYPSLVTWFLSIWELVYNICGDSQVVLVVRNPPADAGEVRVAGSIPGLGRSPGGGHGNPLQYSCLENPMDRAPWRLWSAGLQSVRHAWSDVAQERASGSFGNWN